MPPKRSSGKGGGSFAGGDASGAGSKGDEVVSATFSELVLGGGPPSPVYGKLFSRRSSLRFYQEYEEYERSVELSDSGQTIKRPLLSVSQLLRKNVRSCLSRTFFPGQSDISDGELWEALAKHAECWTRAAMDPAVAASTVTRIVGMGSEATAEDRVDAIQGNLEAFFENLSPERVFRHTDGTYKSGPAHLTTKALVAGLKPREFKVKVEGVLSMGGTWKHDPGMVFDTVRSAAKDWRTVEQTDKQRALAKGKPGDRGKTAPRQSQQQQLYQPQKKKSVGSNLVCWTYGEAGHKAPDCRSPAITGQSWGPRQSLPVYRAHARKVSLIKAAVIDSEPGEAFRLNLREGVES